MTIGSLLQLPLPSGPISITNLSFMSQSPVVSSPWESSYAPELQALVHLPDITVRPITVKLMVASIPQAVYLLITWVDSSSGKINSPIGTPFTGMRSLPSLTLLGQRNLFVLPF